MQIETTKLLANVPLTDEIADSNPTLFVDNGLSIDSLQYHSLLQEELREVHNLMLESHGQTPPQVSKAIGCIINSGGKRLRPALVLLSAHLCGADIRQAIPLAAAVEMLHTATLIHDDLIDKASIRRGVKTLNARWPSSVAVLAGDIAFAWAANLATRGKNLDLIVRFCEVLEVICNGELLQIFGEREIPPIPLMLKQKRTAADLDSYLRAYYKRTFAKTASLFALAAEVGPRLANLSPAEIQKLQEFGKLVGQAFQIADDVLDLMGTEELLGKPMGSDLKQGLVTLPVLRYLEAYPEDDRVLKILYRNKFPEKRKLVREFIVDFRHSGIAEQVIREAAGQIEMALTYLNPYPATPYRQAMEEIALFAVQRRY